MQVERQIFDGYENFKKWFEKQKGQYLTVEEPDNLLYGVVFIGKVSQVGLLQVNGSNGWSNNQGTWEKLKSKAVEFPYAEVHKIIASLQNPFKVRLEKKSDIPRIPMADGKILSSFNPAYPISKRSLGAKEIENITKVKRGLADYLKIETMKDKAMFWAEMLDELIERLIKEEKKIKKVLPNCVFFLRAEDLIPAINPGEMEIALVGYRLFTAVGT